MCRTFNVRITLQGRRTRGTYQHQEKRLGDRLTVHTHKKYVVPEESDNGQRVRLSLMHRAAPAGVALRGDRLGRCTHHPTTGPW